MVFPRLYRHLLVSGMTLIDMRISENGALLADVYRFSRITM